MTSFQAAWSHCCRCLRATGRTESTRGGFAGSSDEHRRGKEHVGLLSAGCDHAAVTPPRRASTDARKTWQSHDPVC